VQSFQIDHGVCFLGLLPTIPIQLHQRRANEHLQASFLVGTASKKPRDWKRLLIFVWEAEETELLMVFGAWREVT